MGFFRRGNVKKGIRKKRLAFCLAFLLLLFLSVSIYFFLPHLEFFKLKFIEVKGVQRGFQTKTVLERSGLHPGVPLFSIHLEEVISRLKEDQWVREVRITRQIPRTLVIQITEYEPKFILSLDKLYYISETGKIFKELEAKDSKEFPIFTGINRQEIEQDPSETRQIFSQGIDLLEKYRKSGFSNRFDLSKVHYDEASGFNLFSEKQKLKILIGSGDFDKKMKRLELAIRQLGEAQRSFSTLDLNYEGKVILTSEKGG